jgi:hypothetical protein
MYKYLFLSTLIILLVTFKAQAQSTSKWGVVARFGDERGSFIFYNPTKNVYHKELMKPMGELGISRKHYEGKRGGYWFQDLLLGYSHQTYEEKVISVGTKTGYQWALWNKILLVPTLGIAYNRAKPNDLRYAYNGDKWVSVKNDLPALNRFNASAAMGIGYRINSKLEVTAHYQMSLINNYIPEIEQPINVLKSVNIAVRYWLGK